MATDAKRNTLKKVDGEQMLKGVYLAAFTDGTTFKADIRELPTVDGEGKPDGGSFGGLFDALPPMAQRVMIYGLKQKLDDAQAGVDNVKDAVEELQSTWDAIKKNAWTLRVPGEGVEGGLFQRAYADWKGIPLSDAKAKISELVARNLKANQEAEQDEKKRADITERRVFNSLRDAMLGRYEPLAAKYKELQEKRKSKPKESGLTIDTTGLVDEE